MKKVKVALGDRGYEIRIGSGLLARAGLWLKDKDPAGKAVIITDSNVNALYGEALARGLGNAGFQVTTLEVPAGEENKSLANAGRLYQALTDAYAERSTPILALGGGMVGDLAGFVAATYMRGVPLVQVPTTLLAQVDSSIGGKTAVDHGQLKNSIGVFYQPHMVIADIDTLQTLPEAELANGLAEAIKSAAIRNRGFFHFLENNLSRALAHDAGVLEEIVVATAGIKADVVSHDEKETGLRSLLNYGHTVGHALETASGFSLQHGQAVAIGMVVAAKIAGRLGVLDPPDITRLTEAIARAGLPTAVPDLKTKDIILAMAHDKKVQNEKLKFVLLKAIGEAYVTDEVGIPLVEEALGG